MHLVFLNKLKEIIKKKKLFVFLIFIFAFYFNNIYSNIGVLPLDTFYHFDPGYRVMQGFFPIKDFWVVSGIMPDLMQAFFFSVFGVNWTSLVIHSSVFNGILAVTTFLFFQQLGLSKIYSLLYSLFFAILAYPISGTPFADHHGVFFSLLAIYCFILAVKTEKNFYWVLVIFLLVFSFFSKQVPAVYVGILFCFITIFYCIINRKIEPVSYSVYSLILLTISLSLLFYIFQIDLKSFFIQYILYPPSIAADRIKNFGNFSTLGFIHEFKFVLIPLFLLFIFHFLRVLNNNNYIKKNDFIIFLGLFAFTISLLFYQTITKNQNLTHFLSIILFAYLHSCLLTKYLKYKKFFIIFILLSTIFITLKIHFEFNETRKFHDLKSANLENTKDASYIDKKLKNLKWLSTNYTDDPLGEMEYLKNTLEIIKNDKRKKMVITNYLFFSSILGENLNSPSRSFTPDGASFPKPGNKYFKEYENFFKKILL